MRNWVAAAATGFFLPGYYHAAMNTLASHKSEQVVIAETLIECFDEEAQPPRWRAATRGDCPADIHDAIASEIERGCFGTEFLSQCGRRFRW